MLKNLILFFTILLIFTNQASATTLGQENPDSTYDPNIVTVLLYPAGYPLNEPVINLNSNQQLQLSFDDLNSQYSDYHYTIIHCTSDWKTSQLSPMDYISGYLEGNISQYQFSFNTLTPYIHYNLLFPTEEMKPKISGNYLLEVYLNNGGEKQIILTRRFFVVEQSVTVNAKVSLQPIDLQSSGKIQQIDLNCQVPASLSDEAQQHYKIDIRQNQRWDNAKFNIHPTSLALPQLNFDYPNGIVFNGGNAPRFFDMKSYDYLAQNIAKIIRKENYYLVTLHTDYSRADKPFETYTNLHGNEMITTESDRNPSTEGDYALVNFRLKVPEFKNAKVYILGALTGWQFNSQNLMKYNPSSQEYEGQLLLKQGYYEYWYAIVTPGNPEGNVTTIEGNHWDTDNAYTIYVYYHNYTPEYDRLVGVQTIMSH
ncbi:MAG: DUF5103 domain-containing protein [Bacteroidales bacterium]|nr:DUF5103 domain-containing protein [Bacteroidales bacterium]